MLFLHGFFSQGLQSKGTRWGHKANGKHVILITFPDVSGSEDGKWWRDDVWVIHNGSCEAFSCDIFHIYNKTLTVMSTQQSVLGFQKMLGTETKILNVKSPSWETNTCPDIIETVILTAALKSMRSSLHSHTWESWNHSS